MAIAVEGRAAATSDWRWLDLAAAAVLRAEDALSRLGSGIEGLSSEEAQRRLEAAGPNALRSHGAQPLRVLTRQLRNPLLILLLAAALTSFFVGDAPMR